MNREEMKQKIKELVEKTSLHVGEFSVVEDEETGFTWFQIRSEESNLFIGRNGETLQALNHLIRRLVEKNFPENAHLIEMIVDVNEYQKKKVDGLKAVAHMMAERARYFKSSVEVDPMSSYDRKIIHTYLSNKNDLQTESVGEGHNRRVVIKYIGS